MDNVILTAIFDKLKKVESQQNQEFEFVETITVSEEDVVVIERTQEPNGTAYCFKDVIVNFEFEASDTTTYLLCYANNLGVASIGNLVNTTKQYSTLQIKLDKGFLFSEYQVEAIATASSAVRARNLELRAVEDITSLKFTCSVPIPVGSKITIYAIRK